MVSFIFILAVILAVGLLDTGVNINPSIFKILYVEDGKDNAESSEEYYQEAVQQTEPPQQVEPKPEPPQPPQLDLEQEMKDKGSPKNFYNRHRRPRPDLIHDLDSKYKVSEDFKEATGSSRSEEESSRILENIYSGGR